MEKYIPLTAEDPREAIAVFGAASTVLNSTLRNKVIPSVPTENSNLPYVKRIHRSGLKLYYMIPVLENIQPEDHGLAWSIRSRYDSPEQAAYCTTYEQLLNEATGNARLSNFKLSFLEALGSEVWHKINSASAIQAINDFPYGISKAHKEKLKNDLEFDDNDVDLREVELIQKKLSLSEQFELFSRVIKQKGVLFYCNKRLLDYDIRAGYESEQEILITPKELLPIDVLMGYQPLSEFDLPDQF